MHFLTPSLLGGGWEDQQALFDRISNTVSSCLVHFMIILVVFLRWMETLRDHLVMSCINFQVSELLLQSSFETWLLLSCGSLSSIRDVF